MKSTLPSSGVSRRVLISTAAVLPSLPGLVVAIAANAQAPSRALPSWNEGTAKQAILDFVRATTDRSSKNFIAPEDRIATFDQDGTLWVEHPLYTQAVFAIDRAHALMPQHPEWQSHEPFKAVLSNNLPALAHFNERDWAEIIFVTHAGMSQAAFLEITGQWLATAKHPRFKRLYTELVYQPMIEVLGYLRANQFETFIVTGGGQDFVRAYGQRVYGIPTQKVIGSSIATKYDYQDGRPELMRLPKYCSSTIISTARPSASICSSASAPTPLSAIPPAISRCWSGPARARARGSRCSFITTMRSGNMPTARRAVCQIPRSAPLPRPCTTRPKPKAGP
jgi:hypothetical protein